MLVALICVYQRRQPSLITPVTLQGFTDNKGCQQTNNTAECSATTNSLPLPRIRKKNEANLSKYNLWTAHVSSRGEKMAEILRISIFHLIGKIMVNIYSLRYV